MDEKSAPLYLRRFILRKIYLLHKLHVYGCDKSEAWTIERHRSRICHVDFVSLV